MPDTSSAPFTLPDRSPLFKPVPRLYKGYRKLSLICEGDADGIARSLPAGFAADGRLIEIFIMHCPEVHDLANEEMGPRNYMEGGVVVPVRYGDLRGGHVLYEYVTTDDAMAGGREVWGYPKKLAEVTFAESGSGEVAATVSRLGRTLIDARFRPAEVAVDKPLLHPRIQVKRIPRADGKGFDVDQVIRNELRDPKVHARVTGTATVSLGGSPIMDPVHELGVGRVVGADFVVADFILDYGTIHEDRLAAG
jgi:acetoacetate decarboxylase